MFLGMVGVSVYCYVGDEWLVEVVNWWYEFLESWKGVLGFWLLFVVDGNVVVIVDIIKFLYL